MTIRKWQVSWIGGSRLDRIIEAEELNISSNERAVMRFESTIGMGREIVAVFPCDHFFAYEVKQ